MEVPGLSVQLDIMTPETEQGILNWLDTQPWSSALSRRTQHYGFDYNYKGGAITQGTPLTGPILEVADILQSLQVTFNQCIVNEYTRSQGIAAHVDSVKFGSTIVGFSLGADCVMTFTKAQESVDVFLPRRSVLVMSGESRYEWKHGISKKVTYTHDGVRVTKPADYRRVSLTYREVRN